MSCFCFFDLETTGFNIEGKHIVEIGYVICSKDPSTNQFCPLKEKSIIIKPTDWEVEMSCIHGITQQMAEDQGIPFEMAIDIWYKDIIDFNCDTLIGHNICRFDMPFVRRDIRYYNLEEHPLYEMMFTITRYDTLIYAQKNNLPYKSLNSLLWYYFPNYERNQAHRAVSDCLDTIMVATKFFELGGFEPTRHRQQFVRMVPLPQTAPETILA